MVDPPKYKTIWLEEWPRLSKKQTKEEIANWDEEKAEIAGSLTEKMVL